MNFTEQTQKAIEKVTNEKLPEMIEQQTEKMINEIVKDIFSWGDVKKSIKAKIEESINVNLQKFDLIDYNALIAKTINENLISQINLQPILDMTQDILGFVDEKEITLEKIAQLFIDASMEDDEREPDGEITFLVETHDTYKWVEVYADVEPDTDKHNCSVKFIFSTDGNRDGKIFSIRTIDSWTGKSQPVSPLMLASLRSIEAKIFRLYSAQVKITSYHNTPETSWSRYN